MLTHRLNYGSIKINWDPPADNPGTGNVSVSCRCVCGKLLVGEGASFVEAARHLERGLADHAATYASGEGMHQPGGAE